MLGAVLACYALSCSEGRAARKAAEPAPDLSIAQSGVYARARMAEASRSLADAAAAYREALALDPHSVEIARRAYRQAVLAGDRTLALQTAAILDADGQLSRDGTVLLLIDALDRRQWNEAWARIDRLEAEGNLSFLASYMRSWLTVVSGSYSPPVMPEDQARAAFAGHYLAEQTLLLTLARGDRDNLDTAWNAADARIASFGAAQRARIAVQLDRMKRPDLALSLLAPDDDVRAKALLARMKKLYRKHQFTPQYGLATLMERLAVDLRGQGDDVATLSIARMAEFADPANDDVRVTIARLAFDAGYPQAAWDEVAKVAPASPAWLDAQTVQLRLLVERGEKAEAIARAEQLARQDAGSVRVWRLLGDLWMEDGRWQDAAQAYEQARVAAGEREDPSLLLQLGAAYEQAGDWAQARPLLERVADLAPDSAVALNHLGYALADRGEDLPRAISLLEKANRLRPGEPAYVDSLGWAFFRSGRYDRALPLLQQAAAAEPGNSELNEHLGDVLWAAGRRFEARYAWKAALVVLDEEGDNASVRQRLQDKIDGKAVAAPARR